jgi:subtilisin-like proprotein convertase family protein
VNFNFFKRFSLLILLLLIASCGGSSPPNINLSSSSNLVILDTDITLSWNVTNADTCIASGSWSGSRPLTGSETITVSKVGINRYTLTCNGSSSSVDVEAYRVISGVVVDGYIRGAEIFIDTNQNFIKDLNEYTAMSDNNGSFENLRYANGNLISIGGHDVDTSIPLENFMLVHKINSYEEFISVNPLTTISAFLSNPDNVNDIFGIDQSIDVYKTDPVAYLDANGARAMFYEKGAQITFISLSIKNLLDGLVALESQTMPQQIFYRDIYREIALYSETIYNNLSQVVNIEEESFISNVLNNTLSYYSLNNITFEKNTFVELVKNFIPVIQAKDENYLNAAISNFMLSDFQNDISSLIAGNLSNQTISNYQIDVLNYIGNSQNIDSSLLAPNIFTTDDVALTPEDVNKNIFFLLNDIYLESAPYTIDIIQPSNGTVEYVDGYFTYSPDQDYYGNDSFTYSISQGNKSSSSNVAIIITPVNDAPVFQQTTYNHPENETLVDEIQIYDVDGDDLIVTLNDSIELFNVSADECCTYYLNFLNAPDFETDPIEYLISMKLSDGQINVDQDILLNVTNVNDIPPIITTQSLNAEQTCKNIANLQATDEDGDDLTNFAWTISGSDSELFDINNETGYLSFKNSPRGELSSDHPMYDENDIAQKDSFSLDVEVTDGQFIDNQTVTVNLLVDPLFEYQWYLENMGQKNFADFAGTVDADSNHMAVNCEFSGAGSLIATVDWGLELAHEDLVSNIIPGSYDWVEDDDDPTNPNDGDHGTGVSGIMTMTAANGVGGRGIAYGASLVGYNWGRNQSDANLISSWTGLDYTVSVDVTNNSWGMGTGTYLAPGDTEDFMFDAVKTITNTSRNGKGTIHVKSAGNSWGGNCGPTSDYYDEMPCTTSSSNSSMHSWPQIITVPSINADDERSSYSTVGPDTWLAGYGGEYGYGPPSYQASDYPESYRKYFKAALVSTDQSGCDIGYNDNSTNRNAFVAGNHPDDPNCNYTVSMNGTSSAGPTVAAFAAVLLEVNPEFTWRDIKHIMANTGAIVDADNETVLEFNETNITMHDWITNSAGYSHHNWFGFGKLDIKAGIEFARTMTPNNLGSFITYELIDADSIDPNWVMNIADQINTDTITVSANASSNGKIEWTVLRLWFDWPYIRDIGVRLTSPDGTTINAKYPYSAQTGNPKDLATDETSDDYYVDIGIAGFYGENIAGDWTIEVINWESDNSSNTTGTLDNWGLIFYGN